MMVGIFFRECKRKVNNRYSVAGTFVKRLISIPEFPTVRTPVANNTDENSLFVPIHNQRGKLFLFLIMLFEGCTAYPAVRTCRGEDDAIKECDD
ncbi:MAG: hypothetical protein D5R99_06145 [Methanocalculus sp. MSAO_Arc1]|nr:MAG: hypothetical protein D5R99_06145 [Methanocalculus sp. MSAO_Arc1]